MKRSHLLALLEFTHDMAENYLVWSPERILCLENAHQAFMQWRKRKKGRPNKEDGVDSDIRALMYMGEQRRKTGETSNRKLARMAIEAGLVKKKGSMDSRIERRARKYGNRRRESARQPRLTRMP